MAGHRTYLCMKHSMIFSCAVIFLSGMLLVGLGAWMKHGAATLVDLMGHYFMQLINLSYICIAMGSIVSLTSIMGCAGACRENRCLLTMFFVIMMMWVVAQTVGVTVILVYSNSVGFMLYDIFKDSLVKFYMGVAAPDPISTAWNVVMTKGCFNKVIDVIKRDGTALGAAVGSMGVVEIGSLMLSMILFMKLGSMHYEVRDRKHRVRPQTSEHREA
ncbi:tetraspanin-18-like isoform X1 [Alosa alosa]|nr:tetraspanin-18-like isoform X1 [Alosa alosa]